jgi:23S rRNA (guanosine2251-2'-O)-methyltransferase
MKSIKSMLVIGRNPVIETLKFNPSSIHRVFVLQGAAGSKIKKILHELKRLNICVEFKPREEFVRMFNTKSKWGGVSQGVIAEISEYEYADLESLLGELRQKEDAIVVILDEVQDPHNLGAIIRTSVASGVDAMFITEKNSAKVNHTVMKTSSGAANYLKISLSKNIYTTVNELKEIGFKIIGTSLNAVIDHYDYDYKGKVVLVFGSESEGLRKNILKLCDGLIKIPIVGNSESLNVSVAAGVILYEILRQKQIYKLF